MSIGVWRSWLAHLHGVQGVESSSLFTPTKKKRDDCNHLSFLVISLQFSGYRDASSRHELIVAFLPS